MYLQIKKTFKNSENKEGEYCRVKTYNKLNCVTCEKTLHEESSLVGHKRDTPDMKVEDEEPLGEQFENKYT